MLDSLLIVFPVFAVVGLGWLSGRLRLGPAGMGEAMAGFVFTFGLPSLLFRTIVVARPTDANPWNYWGAYFLGVAVIWCLGMLVGRLIYRLPPAENAIAGFSTAQANTVMMGIPLIMRTFGDAGATPLFLLVAIHLPVTMTVATLLVERTLGGRPTPARLLRQLAMNPIMIGIVAAVLIRESGFALPAPALATVEMLAAAAAPCALFTLGIAVEKYGIRENIGLLTILSTLKALVHPLLVYGLARFLFGMPPLWVGVAVLFAASPSGINAYLLAERYRTGVALSSGTILISTLLSLPATVFWVWLVSP